MGPSLPVTSPRSCPCCCGLGALTLPLSHPVLGFLLRACATETTSCRGWLASLALLFVHPQCPAQKLPVLWIAWRHVKGTDQMGGRVLHEPCCGDLILGVVIIQKQITETWGSLAMRRDCLMCCIWRWPLAESSCLPQEAGLTSLKLGGVT